MKIMSEIMKAKWANDSKFVDSVMRGQKRYFDTLMKERLAKLSETKQENDENGTE